MEDITFFEPVSQMDLSDIDLSNVSENLSNAGQIAQALLNKLIEYISDVGINLVVALLMLIIGWKLINILSRKIKEGRLLTRIDATTRSFLRSFITIFLKILLVITAAAVMGVPMASMVAVLGSCGLAIGLAVQGSLSNIAGGFILTVFKPFAVGDYICSGEYEGTVKSINIFYTKIVTSDNKIITIPNSKISDSALIDFSSLPTRRIDIDTTVISSADCEEVKRALLDCAMSNEHILADPPPCAAVSGFEGGTVMYKLQVWCPTELYWQVKYALNESVKLTFEERKIEMPRSQVEVYISRDGNSPS